MTELCGVCGGIIDLTDELEEFYYEDYGGTAVHVACRPRKGTDMAEDPKERGIVTKLTQGLRQSDGKPYAFFYLNGKHDKDADPSYSLDMRQPGAPVPTEGDSIYFTYKINGAYNNVIMFEKVEPTEGEVQTVAATVSATQSQRDESFYRTAALKQAVIFVGTQPVDVGLQEVDRAYLHFVKLLTNPASLREPGDVTNDTGRPPKPVAGTNPPRDEAGYIIRASEADQASQDAQGAPPEEYPPDHPKHVATGAPA